MEKKEFALDDIFERQLMLYTDTVGKIATVIIVVVLIFGILLGVAGSNLVLELSGSWNDFSFLGFLIGCSPCVLSVVIVWAIKTLVCFALEYMAKMHCYARTQTEILAESREKVIG